MTSNEQRRRTLPIDDPTPGPRDAAALVAHFDALLPDDVDTDGVFSLGTEYRGSARQRSPTSASDPAAGVADELAGGEPAGAVEERGAERGALLHRAEPAHRHP